MDGRGLRQGKSGTGVDTARDGWNQRTVAEIVNPKLGADSYQGQRSIRCSNYGWA